MHEPMQRRDFIGFEKNAIQYTAIAAKLQYTPLRRLAMVKDWLGETRIERDSYILEISDKRANIMS